VKILSVLQISGGFALLGVGMILMVTEGLQGTIEFGLMVIMCLLSLVVSAGYLNGSGWSWTVGLTISVLGLVMGLMSFPSGLIRVPINLLIIYYLTRPHVKMFFGKSQKLAG